MLLKRFYDAGLAQASYMVGCQAAGEAIVVDPNRDVEQYVRAAAEEGVKITRVTETHIHADFVSGSRELAARTGAELLLSDEGGEDWTYGFGGADGVRLLKDSDTIRVGKVRLDVHHTPGHTPEHLSFIVTDSAATDRPMGVLTGDFIFVGDVGRPDLLERAAKVAGSMDASARALYHSIQRFKQLQDYLQLWPGHGAGSACGKALGAVPSTTLGYERLANWALNTPNEEAFVAAVLAGQPEPPRYFAHMKRVNRDGPKVLGGLARVPKLDDSQLESVLRNGRLVVDTRSAVAFASGHVPGTVNIPLNKSFTTWAGSLLPYDQDFLLLADAGLDEAVRSLRMIGLERVSGRFGLSAIEAWRESGKAMGVTRQLSPSDLDKLVRDGEVHVLDVRAPSEWSAGHLPRVANLPLGQLPDRMGELPRDIPIAVHCQSGGRSAIAASLLRANGFQNVSNVAGGYGAWVAEGRPVEVE